MRAGGWLSIVLAMWWCALASPASACTCVLPTLQGSYEAADHVVHVKVLRLTKETPRERVYLVRLLEKDFKGCLAAGADFEVATAPAEEMCGMPMPVDAEMLLFADRHATTDPLRVTLCSGSAVWRAFSDMKIDALRAKPVCCGDACACANGESPVQCFADPCSVSSCEIAGASCTANYCGGCSAQWYDPRGARVCAPAPRCDYEDKDRRYFARSREACKAVRFACKADEQMFIDDCGCGCATPLTSEG